MTEKTTEVATDEINDETAISAKVKKGVEILCKGMKSKFASCKKVLIKIPINQLNPKDLEVVVQINGYIFQIKRGVEVEVPAPVKAILENGGYL